MITVVGMFVFVMLLLLVLIAYPGAGGGDVCHIGCAGNIYDEMMLLIFSVVQIRLVLMLELHPMLALVLV